MIVICLFKKSKNQDMILTKKNVATLLYCPPKKKEKKSSKSKEKINPPALSIKKKKSARDSRPSQPAMRSTTKLGKKPISFKIDFEILQNDHPPSCPPPYTDNEK